VTGAGSTRADARRAYDVVVIGSGFGGSVMTYRLSRAGLNVCLLERGHAYPPGSFLRGPSRAKANFWYPPAGLYGLFNVWSFRRMAAIVSSGLGGGSLIYANVLLRKPAEWFACTMPGGEPWPFTYDDLEPHYSAVEQMLGGTEYPSVLRRDTPKTLAFVDGAKGAGLEPFFPKLAITFADPGHEGRQFDDGSANRFNVERYGCRLVGECDVGCNFGAKNTLDLTYLSQLGPNADVRVCCDAKTLRRRGDLYEVGYVDHAAGGVEESVSARRVVIAAGSLGSTYLLLKNCEALGGLSAALGSRFSGNGDLLTFAIGARANGRARAIDPGFGPVITAAALAPDTEGKGRDLYLEDGGGPNAVWWMGEVVEAPRIVLRVLPTAARLLWKALSRHPARDVGADLSTLLGNSRLVDTLPLLGMGRDLPLGQLELRKDGLLDLRWAKGDMRAYYRRASEVAKGVATSLGAKHSDLSFKINYYATVHPLGGCPAASTRDRGVVDGFGRVFGHEGGLYVADGSVMPGPVGANPSLTIAAFADRAAAALLAEA
jgi:cholesterol oxidase